MYLLGSMKAEITEVCGMVEPSSLSSSIVRHLAASRALTYPSNPQILQLSPSLLPSFSLSHSLFFLISSVSPPLSKPVSL
jgi:hypothetical protein